MEKSNRCTIQRSRLFDTINQSHILNRELIILTIQYSADQIERYRYTIGGGGRNPFLFRLLKTVSFHQDQMFVTDLAWNRILILRRINQSDRWEKINQIKLTTPLGITVHNQTIL